MLRPNSGKRFIAATTLALALVALAPARAADPDAQAQPPATIDRIWRHAVQYPHEAEPLWHDFAAANPDDDRAFVARLFAGIEQLREPGEPDARRAAADLFRVPPPPDDAAPLHAHRRNQLRWAGRAWTARLHMIDLAEKLRACYRDRVAYPPSLDDLVEGGYARPADLLDPFAARFVYTASPRPLMPEVPRQRFTLACETTGATHASLADAVDRRYEPLDRVALSSVSPDRGQAYVRVRNADGARGLVQRWRIGQTLDSMTLWAVYDRWILVGDRDLPKVVVHED